MEHAKDSVDLGTLCGKPFPVSAMVILEPGDSKILELVKK
jgi:large subunit ribosomal protein L30e